MPVVTTRQTIKKGSPAKLQTGGVRKPLNVSAQNKGGARGTKQASGNSGTKK